MWIYQGKQIRFWSLIVIYEMTHPALIKYSLHAPSDFSAIKRIKTDAFSLGHIRRAPSSVLNRDISIFINCVRYAGVMNWNIRVRRSKIRALQGCHSRSSVAASRPCGHPKICFWIEKLYRAPYLLDSNISNQTAFDIFQHIKLILSWWGKRSHQHGIHTHQWWTPWRHTNSNPIGGGNSRLCTRRWQAVQSLQDIGAPSLSHNHRDACSEPPTTAKRIRSGVSWR